MVGGPFRMRWRACVCLGAADGGLWGLVCHADGCAATDRPAIPRKAC